MRQRPTNRPRIDKFGNVHPPRPVVPGRVAAAVAGLLVLSFLAWGMARAFVSSFERYAPPAVPDIAAGEGSTPAADRAVVVVISGLRADLADEMPTLRTLSQRGASALVNVAWPTTAQTSWTTLLSGTDPELAGAAALTASDRAPRPIAVDNLVQRTRVTRRTVGLAGQRQLLAMLPDLAGGRMFLADNPADDARVVQAALDILADSPPDLLIVQLANVDAVGASRGGRSDEYYRAALQADEQVARLLAGIDLQTTLVVVTSDYGHLDGGGHGGTESLVATVPLIMAGPGVRGDRPPAGAAPRRIKQQDVAPTVAALIGLPIPALSRGAIRFDMLALTPPLEAEKAVALAEQQVRLAAAYRAAMGAEPPAADPAATLDVAKSAWDIRNFPATVELAAQAELDARRAMASAREARIAAERSARLPAALALLGLLAVGVIVMLNRQRLWLVGVALLSWLGPLGDSAKLAGQTANSLWLWSPAVAGAVLAISAAAWARRASSGPAHNSRRVMLWIAALAALTLGLLFAVRPLQVSPSALHNLGDWRNAMLGPVLAALLLGGGAVVVLDRDSGGWRDSVSHSLLFIGVLIVSLAVELIVSYWRLGPSPTWYLPEPQAAYGRLAALLQLMLVAGLGVLLPLLVVPSVHLLQRRRLSRPAMSGGAAPDAQRVRL